MRRLMTFTGCLLCAGLLATQSGGASDEAAAGSVRNSAAANQPQEKKPVPADSAIATPADDKASADRWMLAKRHHAHEIFSGLTDGDYERIANGGRRMLVTGILEKWLRDSEFAKQSDYKGQLNAFEFANKELIRHAENQDIDGALTAYVKLSQSCVRCHKLVRDAKAPNPTK